MTENPSVLLQSISKACRAKKRKFLAMTVLFFLMGSFVLGLFVYQQSSSSPSEIAVFHANANGLWMFSIMIVAAILICGAVFIKMHIWEKRPEQHSLFRKWQHLGTPSFFVYEIDKELKQPGAFLATSGILMTKSWGFLPERFFLFSVDDVVGTTYIEEKEHPAVRYAGSYFGLLGALIVWLFTRKKASHYRVSIFMRQGAMVWTRVSEADIKQWVSAVKAHAPWAFIDTTRQYESSWYFRKKKWIEEAQARKEQKSSFANPA